MKYISEITRRDIVDLINNGIFYPFSDIPDDVKESWITSNHSNGINIKINYYGRCEVVDFLDRIYNLEEMPSYDRRCASAKGDIQTHLGFGDIEENFVFSDDRFELSKKSDDEHLLSFLCEMFHPAVRIEDSGWSWLLQIINELLKVDGYELYPVRKISGRDIYSYRRLDYIEIETSIESKNYDLQLIGNGSYANVFKFKDDFYNKSFALKRAKKDLNEKELERFKLEFKEMQEIDSKYVLEVYSYNDEKNEYVMEYMDETLEKYIDSHNATLTLAQRRYIGIQLLNAFESLHKYNILHRDISPKNILVKIYADGPVFKISDFGLVKLPDSDLTSTNTEIKGYLNDPSLRITGFKNYNIQHEIYALTLLLVYVLTGKSNYANIKDINVCAFMKKGTEQVINNRYKDVQELRAAFVECVNKMKD